MYMRLWYLLPFIPLVALLIASVEHRVNPCDGISDMRTKCRIGPVLRLPFMPVSNFFPLPGSHEEIIECKAANPVSLCIQQCANKEGDEHSLCVSSCSYLAEATNKK